MSLKIFKKHLPSCIIIVCLAIFIAIQLAAITRFYDGIRGSDRSGSACTNKNEI